VRNRKDYDEIPQAARNALSFLWAERVEDVRPRARSSR
jgi:hypothetical protein